MKSARCKGQDASTREAGRARSHKHLVGPCQQRELTRGVRAGAQGHGTLSASSASDDGQGSAGGLGGRVSDLKRQMRASSMRTHATRCHSTRKAKHKHAAGIKRSPLPELPVVTPLPPGPCPLPLMTAMPAWIPMRT